jgi:alkylation response protein AidB-like acyl-CoA dehydrogenase
MNAQTQTDWTADDETAILNAIDKWVEGEVRPIAREHDQADTYPHELVEQMKELGLFGAIISPEYGGLGLPASTYAKIVVKVAREGGSMLDQYRLVYSDITLGEGIGEGSFVSCCEQRATA